MILGTAGHVDHGKTTLVKALTGVDTDRLAEEKRRGITIELGFAHLTLPSGARVGVVDVPGHERFVKAMTAGATGIDVAVLVLAADEGVMPQTREHVDICALLGVRAGVIAITKADLLPPLGPEWPALLTTDVEQLTRGTFLEHAKTIFLSAKTGEGLPALVAELDRLSSQLSERSADGPLFLPIDRAFSVKGFGCVVTGTVASGRIAVGDEVQLTPSSLGPARVRGVQVHGQSVDVAVAGSRAAINVHGVETSDVSRGLALTKPAQLEPARAVDVEVTLLPSVEAPLARRSRQLICVGTEQREAIVQLVNADALRPGETCFAQLRFAQPIAAMPGLRFILRGTTAVSGRGATMGGGRLLTLNPPRRRAKQATSLESLASADVSARVGWLLEHAGYAGLTLEELLARAACPPKELQRVVDIAASKSAVVLIDKDVRRYVSGAVLGALEARLLARVEAFHREHPERDGVGREELRQRLGDPLEKTFARVLTSLVAAKRLEVEKELVRIPGKGRAFDEAAKALRVGALTALNAAGLQPPTVTELSVKLSVPEGRVVGVLTALVTEGVVVKADTLFFAAAPVAELEARLVAFLQTNDGITTQQFKELAGQSRKFLIPLAEHFDAKKVTLRVGDKRVLRKR